MSLIREALERVERQREALRTASFPESSVPGAVGSGGRRLSGRLWILGLGGVALLVLLVLLLDRSTNSPLPVAEGQSLVRNTSAAGDPPPSPEVRLPVRTSPGPAAVAAVETELPPKAAPEPSPGAGPPRMEAAAPGVREQETAASPEPSGGERGDAPDGEGVHVRVHPSAGKSEASPPAREGVSGASSAAEGLSGLRDAYQRHPSLSTFRAYLERVQVEADDEAGAALLAEGLTRFSERVEIYRLAANQALRQKEYQAAAHWASEGLRRAPGDPDCLTFRGLAALHHQELDLAEQSFRQAFKTRPEALENLYYLGLVHDRRGDWTRALASYLRFVREYPPEKAFAHRHWVRRRILWMEEKIAGGGTEGSVGQRHGG